MTLCCALRPQVTEQTLLDSQALAHRSRKAVLPGMPSAEVQHSEEPPPTPLSGRLAAPLTNTTF